MSARDDRGLPKTPPWTDASKADLNAEANCRHLAGLGDGRGRWQEHIERGAQVLGVRWDKLPLAFRRKWWKATDYGRRPDKHLPAEAKVLAADLAALKADKREAVADTAAARELLRQAEAQWPCEQCLRPASPCQVRCLRVLMQERSQAIARHVEYPSPTGG